MPVHIRSQEKKSAKRSRVLDDDTDDDGHEEEGISHNNFSCFDKNYQARKIKIIKISCLALHPCHSSLGPALGL